jgi:hypothetical protein
VLNASSSPVTYRVENRAPIFNSIVVRNPTGVVPAMGEIELLIGADPVGDADPGQRTIPLTIVDGTGSELALYVEQIVRGARIVVPPGDVFLGAAPVGEETPAQSLQVLDEGNVADAIVVDTSADTAHDFAVGLDRYGVTARLHPTREGILGLSVPIRVRPGVPLCAPIESSPMRFAGEGLPPSAPRVSVPAVVSLGRSWCGSAPAPVTFELVNSGTTAQSFVLQPPSGTRLTLMPALGMVPAHGRQTITVTSAPVPQTYRPTDVAELWRDRSLFATSLDEALDATFGPVHQRIVVKHQGFGFAYVPLALDASSSSHSASLTLASSYYRASDGLVLPLYSLATLTADPSCTSSELVIAQSRSFSVQCTHATSLTSTTEVNAPLVGQCSPVPGPVTFAIP